MEEALIKAASEWGPGLLIAALLLAGLFRLASGVGMKMVAASEKQAAALSAQAQSMEGLTRSIADFVGRDGSEHREMLVLLRFIAQRQESFDEVRVEHDRRKEQAHPHCPAKHS